MSEPEARKLIEALRRQNRRWKIVGIAMAAVAFLAIAAAVAAYKTTEEQRIETDRQRMEIKQQYDATRKMLGEATDLIETLKKKR